MQNDHEELLATFSERVVGAPFIFAPDEWSKGSARQRGREPADLVWACNQCIVLMYLKRTSRAKAIEKAIGKNLGQARGSLRIWGNGGVMRGHNTYQTFSIAYGAYRHIVVVSIADGPGAFGRYHPKEAQQLGLTQCATLPGSVIARLGSMRASLIDLLTVINWLRCAGEEVPEDHLLSLMSDYQRRAWEDSGALKLWPDNVDERFHEAQHHLYGSRLPVPNASQGSNHRVLTPDTGDVPEVPQIFTDLDLTDFLRLTVETRTSIDIVRGDLNKRPGAPLSRGPHPGSFSLIQRLPLRHYEFTLCTVPTILLLEADRNRVINNAAEVARNTSRRGPDLHGPMIFFSAAESSAEILVPPRLYPSYAETLLDQWSGVEGLAK